MAEKVALQGVPETLLWPLYNRAAFASRPGALLNDPRSVDIRNAIDYPFQRHFGTPSEAHALRALRFDDEARRFMSEHPDGIVVALGEGLETGFWRVDNGRVRWLAVHLPESIALRSRWLPTPTATAASRARHSISAGWTKSTVPRRLRHGRRTADDFEPGDVERLIAACAVRFPGSEMMFDVIPRWLSRKTLRGWYLTSHYRTPRDALGHRRQRARRPPRDPSERRRRPRGRHWPRPGIRLRFPRIPFLSYLPIPRFIANKRPAFVVVQLGGTGQVIVMFRKTISVDIR